jgi:hypothetical protein
MGTPILTVIERPVTYFLNVGYQGPSKNTQNWSSIIMRMGVEWGWGWVMHRCLAEKNRGKRWHGSDQSGGQERLRGAPFMTCQRLRVLPFSIWPTSMGARDPITYTRQVIVRRWGATPGQLKNAKTSWKFGKMKGSKCHALTWPAITECLACTVGDFGSIALSLALLERPSGVSGK